MTSPETLRRFSLFAGLAPVFFKDLAMIGVEVAFNQGEWLFHEGDQADALYLLLSGTVDLKIALDEAGTRHADLDSLVEGDVVGWSAVVEPYVYTLGAVATTDVRAVKLDTARLRALAVEKPEVGYTLMSRVAQVLGKRLNNLRVRFVSIAV